MSAKFELSLLRDAFVVCRLDASTPVPAWALEPAAFAAVTRTEDELSIICREDRAPQGIAAPDRWRALRVHGPFPPEVIGVLSTLALPLATARVSLLAISTHDTDYLFVRSAELAHAVRVLRHEGHVVHLI